MTIELTCKQCGKPLQGNQSVARRRGYGFCSTECSGAAQSQKVTRVCEVCGGGFSVKPTVVRKGQGRFCSRACKFAGLAAEAADPACVRARFDGYLDTESGPIPEHRPELGRCHIWTGSRQPNGYGRMSVGGKHQYAHRIAFWLEHGRWPEPAAMHLCDNGPLGCARLSHVTEGTWAENNQDKLAKGRQARGQKHAEAITKSWVGRRAVGS